MPGDAPMPFDAAPFDPIKHPLREEALRWWDAGYARQATYSYGKRPPSPFAEFFRGFVAGRDTLRRPVAESVDAAIAALDVEVEIDLGRGETFHTILGLDAVRAAHRAEVERAVREAVEQERAACAFASIDVIRAVMRELDEFSKGEVAENGYIDEGDDDGTGHTPFRNGWTLYGFARNEMCGVLTKVPAAIRARGVAQQRTGSEAPSASDEGAKP